jgi:hypothetical protein
MSHDSVPRFLLAAYVGQEDTVQAAISRVRKVATAVENPTVVFAGHGEEAVGYSTLVNLRNRRS